MSIVEFIETQLAFDTKWGDLPDEYPEALRAIVALHRPIEYNDVTGTDACVICESSGADAEPYWPCATTRHIAAIWSSHPDYDDAAWTVR